jgi:DnaJ-class molecular chaperone
MRGLRRVQKSKPPQRPAKEKKRVTRKRVLWEWCPRCDGCGWYEGGKTLGTTCEQCKGTGKIKPNGAA